MLDILPIHKYEFLIQKFINQKIKYQGHQKLIWKKERKYLPTKELIPADRGGDNCAANSATLCNLSSDIKFCLVNPGLVFLLLAAE